jgi:hypothetical protein
MRLLIFYSFMVGIFSKYFLNTLIRRPNMSHQCIISAKYNHIHCNHNSTQFTVNHDFFKNKKVITISPGGFEGFYLLGLLTYIKEHYNTTDIIYSGASAGAWNGLVMCYKGDPIKFAHNILTDDKIKKAKSLNELQYTVKYKLLTEFTDKDFDIEKLFVGVTTFKNFQFLTNIVSEFDGLEDAINCCIASSHIPLITGGFTNKYKNMYMFDGGFSEYPYLNTMNNVLHVTPNMWMDLDTINKPTNIYIKLKKTVKRFTELNCFRNSALELFDNGYHDAKKNKAVLNIVFNKHNHIYYDDSGI